MTKRNRFFLGYWFCQERRLTRFQNKSVFIFRLHHLWLTLAFRMTSTGFICEASLAARWQIHSTRPPVVPTSLQLLDGASQLRRGKTSTCFRRLNIATLIMKRINIPTSAGLIWLSLNTKTDSSYWRSSCSGMLPWSLHLNCSLSVAAPGGIKEPELDITRRCFIPTCCETSEETLRRWGMILWHALPARWISCELGSVIGLNKTKTLITVIDALWENKMEQERKEKTSRNRIL